MNNETSEVEVYVKAADFGKIISILSNKIGPLKSDESPIEDIGIYEFENVSVVLRSVYDELISVWVRGSLLWPSCPALGRLLAKELDCIVICDPEKEFPDVSPYSDIFLEIDGNNERLISWEEFETPQS